MAFNIRRRPFGATSPINPPQIMRHGASHMGGAPMNEPQPEQPKFGGLGDKLYAIGGLLQGDGGAAVGRYHAMGDQQAMMQQQAAAEAAAAQRKRAMDLADYETKRGIDARYRVESPDSFEKALAGAGIDPASPEGQALYRGRAESMARDPNDEFVVVPIPGRGTYAGPRSGLADAMGAPQSAPQGVTFTPLDDGGPASAPGGFRP